ncbi:helix-turn-helix domain-containing protein [Microbacterium luteum]|uniref:helix-turn-helix domain-containing protein n=1 Tax=Microbacterium luteum TaxID=2782167 RepID=UPI001888D87F|nr:helix-turn-helix domain-containing protein [Microbacterium luteum]
MTANNNTTTADEAAEYLLGDKPRRSTTARRVSRATRKQEALSMRLAGARNDQIAQTLGVHPRTITAWVSDAIKDIPREEADEMRRLELDRLDALQAAVWRNAMKGDARAVDRVLAIMDRRAKYLGLYDEQATGLEQVGSLLDRLVNGEG